MGIFQKRLLSGKSGHSCLIKENAFNLLYKILAAGYS